MTTRFKGKPQSVAGILEKTLKYHRLENKLEEYSGFPYWRSVVGEEIAKVAKPEKIISKKILVVRVLDAVYAQELAFEKENIIEKLNALKIGAIFEDIKFIVGDPRSMQEK